MNKVEAKNILVYQLGFLSNDNSFEQQQFCKALEIAIEALEEDIGIFELAEKYADKIERVNLMSASDLKRAMERARLEGKNVNI